MKFIKLTSIIVECHPGISGVQQHEIFINPEAVIQIEPSNSPMEGCSHLELFDRRGITVKESPETVAKLIVGEQEGGGAERIIKASEVLSEVISRAPYIQTPESLERLSTHAREMYGAYLALKAELEARK